MNTNELNSTQSSTQSAEDKEKVEQTAPKRREPEVYPVTYELKTSGYFDWDSDYWDDR